MATKMKPEVIERRSSTRFVAEALERLRVSRQFIGKEFQSEEAAKLGVLGLVDDAHAPATQLLDDAVVRDGLADHV